MAAEPNRPAPTVTSGVPQDITPGITPDITNRNHTEDHMARLSPLMEQYYCVKRQHPDAVLLFRVGDFYETFDDDAVTISRDLNITLTSRQKDEDGNKIPLAGVPYHALEAYLTRLIKAGHKVVIVDQVEDPKQAKGLVKREITRIVTPGTVIEPSMLEDSSNNFLASIVKEDGRAGLAFVDVSTGEFIATEVPEDRLRSEIAKFRPSECITPSPLSIEGMRIQTLEESFFSPDGAAKALEGQFGPGWGKFGLTSLCIRACGSIISYLHSSHFNALGHVSEIRPYSPAQFMVLDDAALRNLEVLRNIRDRTRRGTLLDLLDRTQTPMGSRTMARWVQMPLISPEGIRRRLDSVDEICGDAILSGSLARALDGVSDLERLVGRISTGNAGPKDLITLRAALERLPEVSSILEGAQSDYLKDLRAAIDPSALAGAVELIGRAVSDDPPAAARDGGAIRDGFDAELDEIRSVLRDGKGWISRLEISERKRTGIKSLKVSYTGVFGYHIEVSKANLQLVPQEYIRKQTLANCERFITPELKEMEAKVLSAQERSAALEGEIFARARDEVAGYSRAIQDRAAALGELDVLLSFALVASENSFVKPEFNSEGRIAIRDSRHPVVAKAMRGGFIPNDVYLDSDKSRLIILTGPNMAGKSTFMRQIALTSILAQAGSFVPASNASLCIIDRILTRVGAYDDLSAGQSTFMVEMTEIANILRSATRDSLILLDEVGRGTSTFDGMSIAWAITEYIHNTVRAKAVFATHYHQLTGLEGVLPGIRNCSMAVKEEGGEITFLRTVVPGATDRSYGVHVARLAGVPDAVVRRADQILKEIEKEAVIDPLAKGRKGKRLQKYTQLIFFDAPQVPPQVPPQVSPQASNPGQNGQDPVLERILELDIDSLTPRDALNRLAEYQRTLRERDREKDAQNQAA